MQDLYLMRGPQGSGKSSFLRDHALDTYSLSSDRLRVLFGSMFMEMDGAMCTSHQYEHLIHEKLKEILVHRMSEGLTTFIDNTHVNGDFSMYRELAQQWNYRVHVVDMGVGIPVSELIERVRARSQSSPEGYVPEVQIRRFADKLKRRPVPEWMNSMTPEQVMEKINAPVADLTGLYRDILFVGDIQGCAEPLKELVRREYRDDRLIIFTGDLFDRGPQNGEVLTIMNELLNEDNVRLICGNHERHILSWMHGRSTPREFRLGTLPQLYEAGFNRDMAQSIINRWENLIQFRFGSRSVQITHGGVPAVIKTPALFPGVQCWKGVGNYNQDVDAVFEQNADRSWCQVHGHRNPTFRDLRPDQRSFNLESSVEYGGYLSALTFDGEKFNPIQIRNRIFVPMTERNLKYTAVVPSWIKSMVEHKVDGQAALEQVKVSREDFKQLRDHSLIRESVQESMPHVSSFNFTRDAFYKQAYDQCNTRARGLYINTHTREIVIRGYDKYFNVNERGIASAQLDTFLKNTRPPYFSSIKENGYLGLIGYDSQEDKLVFASKSTTSGEHALWFEEQIRSMLGDMQLMRLCNILRDAQLSLTFEVIEPEKDPHIIKYDKPQVVLLDGIRRSMDFERLSTNELKSFADLFGFKTREPGPYLPSKEAFARFVRSVSSKGFKHNGKDIEGLVIEDANGNMIKIKLPYYNLWKQARSAANAVVRMMEKGTPIKPHHLSDSTIKIFVEWLSQQDLETAKQDIIRLREAFLAQHPELNGALSDTFTIRTEDDSPAL